MGASPHLLVREQSELDAIALPLQKKERVVAFVVTPSEEVREVARAYLERESGMKIPFPTALLEGQETLDVLTRAAEGGPEEVCSLSVSASSTEALRTLNWHREKLRQGASVIVWIDSIDGLRALRSVAPDAYSFRDVMVVVQGETPVIVIPPEVEPPRVKLARAELARAQDPLERAKAAWVLGAELNLQEAFAESRVVAEGALRELPRGEFPGEDARTARAWLQRILAYGLRSLGFFAAAFHCVRALEAEIIGIDSEATRSLLAFAPMDGAPPTRVDLVASERALDRAAGDDQSHAYFCSHFALASARRGRAQIRLALRELQGLRTSTRYGGAQLNAWVGFFYILAGKLDLAETSYHSSVEQGGTEGTGTSNQAISFVTVLWLKGELDAAKRPLVDMVMRPDANLPFRDRYQSALFLAAIQLDEGDVSSCFSMLRSLLREAAKDGRDGYLFEICATYLTCLREAAEARRLVPSDFADAYVELDVAEAAALAIAKDDPPWYSVLYPSLQAQLTAIEGDLDKAITLFHESLARARSTWPDEAPRQARREIHCLIRAGLHQQALDALPAAIQDAEMQQDLREQALLHGARVAALSRISSPPQDIDVSIAAMRTVLDETGAPRIVAEVLLDLARLLPPSSTHPDPLEWLDEAHVIFLEMPYPKMEAACTEVMGDVLMARGDKDAARRRYLTARGTLQRFHMGLRVPLLDSKISAIS